MKLLFVLFSFFLFSFLQAQPIKILFDATKAEAAGNADWVIDADLFNIGFGNGPAQVGNGTEANPQRIPTPDQSAITSTTAEGYWKGGLSAWAVDLVKKGYGVETLPVTASITYGNTNNPQDLLNYKVFVVCEPNILFTDAEKTAILQFVQNGGGLFMIGDHDVSDRNNDGWDSPNIWNNMADTNNVLLNPFGIKFDLLSFSGTYSNIANLPTNTILHGVMGNVTQVKWSSGTSLTLDPTKNSSVKGIIYKSGTSGNTNVLAATATYGSGKVFAMGDSSPADDGTGDLNDVLYDGWITDAAGNHEKLIINATIWLATTDGANVSGTINYLNTALTPMSNATVTLMNGTTTIASTTSNASGDYLFSGIANGTYTVSVTTTTAWGGVTATDALKMKRHIAGLEILTEPIKLSAADPNNTNTITSTDVLKVQRRLAGLDFSFTRPDWLFEIQTTGGNSITVNGANVIKNIYCLCTADVNGSNIPAK